MRKPEIASWEKHYTQDGDCWDSGAQEIVIKQDDGGGGPYWIIETERWAFDSIDELVELLMAAGVSDQAPTEEPEVEAAE